MYGIFQILKEFMILEAKVSIAVLSSHFMQLLVE